MRITGITLYPISIPFRRSFGHAHYWREKTDTVLLSITSEKGVAGWGEVLPRPYVTGETLAMVLSCELPDLVSRWRGRAFENRDAILEALQQEQGLGVGLAALAGWELAILDLAGKSFGFAAGEILGARTGQELEPGVVIGFDVPTKQLDKHCIPIRMAGIRHAKVKAGQSDDVRRLEIVREVLGPSIPLRVDANGAWSVDEAISRIRRMQRCNVSSVEEPVGRGDLKGMREIREKTGVAVVADESLCSLADARRLLAAQAADVFNIRIGKCGGLLASLALAKLGEEAGLQRQLGTLVGETGILLRAAEIFGERVPGFDFLEGKGQNRHLLVDDVVVGPMAADRSNTPGLGVTVALERVSQWSLTHDIAEKLEGVNDEYSH
jgi:L-Ala-D/L-Glu epimerase